MKRIVAKHETKAVMPKQISLDLENGRNHRSAAYMSSQAERVNPNSEVMPMANLVPFNTTPPYSARTSMLLRNVLA
jgi:hypothetical protein